MGTCPAVQDRREGSSRVVGLRVVGQWWTLITLLGAWMAWSGLVAMDEGVEKQRGVSEAQADREDDVGGHADQRSEVGVAKSGATATAQTGMLVRPVNQSVATYKLYPWSWGVQEGDAQGLVVAWLNSYRIQWGDGMLVREMVEVMRSLPAEVADGVMESLADAGREEVLVAAMMDASEWEDRSWWIDRVFKKCRNKIECFGVWEIAKNDRAAFEKLRRLSASHSAVCGPLKDAVDMRKALTLPAHVAWCMV